MEASGTREVFWEKLLKRRGGLRWRQCRRLQWRDEIGPDGRSVPSGMSIRYVDTSLKAPTLDGVAPTQENARSGKYPIVRQLYMNTKVRRKG